MKTLGMQLAFAVAVCLVVLWAPTRATADGVTVGVGHSWTKSFGDTPFVRIPTLTVDKPNIATATWQGEESGTLVITGVEEGEATLTIKGQVRVVPMGAGAVGGVRDVSATVPIKVIAADEYFRLVILHVGQKISIMFPENMKLGARGVKNSNPSVVFVRRTMKRMTLHGKKKGESTLRFKLLVTKDGEEKEVPGTIWVQVLADKPKQKRIKIGWDALPVGQIIILVPAEGEKKPAKPKKDRRVGLADWPGQEGVFCSFCPSGANYGDIGDLVVDNDTDEPVTVTVPPGMLLESSDPSVQDLYAADVSTETPCPGAEYIGKPTTIGPDQSVTLAHLPGFCPDHEKAPPTKADESVYACRQPDEKSKVLPQTVEMAKKFDVSNLKLEVFEENKARAMMTQGAVWMADSRIDEVKDNELSEAALSAKFFDRFVESAQESLDKMSPEDRQQAETLVKDDLKKIVSATAILAKPATGN